MLEKSTVRTGMKRSLAETRTETETGRSARKRNTRRRTGRGTRTESEQGIRTETESTAGKSGTEIGMKMMTEVTGRGNGVAEVVYACASTLGKGRTCSKFKAESCK